jgi:hypothetical protein
VQKGVIKYVWQDNAIYGDRHQTICENNFCVTIFTFVNNHLDKYTAREENKKIKKCT